MPVNKSNKGFYSSTKTNAVVSSLPARHYSCNGFSKIIQENEPGFTKKCSSKKYYNIPLQITPPPSVTRNNIYMSFYISSENNCSLNNLLSYDAIDHPENFIILQNTDNVLRYCIVKYNSAGTLLWYTYIDNVYSSVEPVYYNNNLVIDDDLGYIYFTGFKGIESLIKTYHVGTPTTPPTSNFDIVNTIAIDGFLLKYDSAGTCIWGTYFGSVNSNSGLGIGIALDTEHNIYLTGHTESGENGDLYFNIYDASVNLSMNTMTPTPRYQLSAPQSLTANYNGYLLKYDSNGISQWGTYFGGVASDYGTNLVLDSANNVYITGITNSSGIGDLSFNIYDASMNIVGTDGSFEVVTPTPKYQLSAPQSLTASLNGYLLKYDSNGISQWGTYFGCLSDDFVSSLALDSANNIYITGSTDSGNGDLSFNIYDASMSSSITDNFFEVVTPTPRYQLSAPQSLTANFNGFLLKYDSSGISQWGTYFGGLSYDFGTNLVIDTANNIYITGSTDSGNGDLSFNIYDASMSSSITDNSFEVVTPTPRYQLSAPQSLTADLNGFLLKYDSNGISQWGTYFGGFYDEVGTSLAIDTANNIYITGFAFDDGDISFNIYDASLNSTGPDGDGFNIMTPELKHVFKYNGNINFILKYDSDGKNTLGSIGVEGINNVDINIKIGK